MTGAEITRAEVQSRGGDCSLCYQDNAKQKARTHETHSAGSTSSDCGIGCACLQAARGRKLSGRLRTISYLYRLAYHELVGLCRMNGGLVMVMLRWNHPPAILGKMRTADGPWFKQHRQTC